MLANQCWPHVTLVCCFISVRRASGPTHRSSPPERLTADSRSPRRGRARAAIENMSLVPPSRVAQAITQPFPQPQHVVKRERTKQQDAHGAPVVCDI